MKHIALLTTLLLSASLQAVEKPYDYVFFENSLMKGDYFYSQAKYTSPSWIKNARHHLPVAGSVAFTPGNSLELTYVSAPGGDWYSEIQYCPVRGNDFFREPSTLSMQVRLRESMNAAALPNICYSLCGQHVYPIPKPEKLSERYTSRRMAFRIYSFEGFRIKRRERYEHQEISGRSPSSRYGPMETNIRFIWTI